jgi:anti-sigma factor RsiW
MTERDVSDLNEEWARTQLEAWADGSLTGSSRERMAAALAASPKLRAAAERAVAVYRALRESSSARMPARLRLKLLAIPGRSAWPAFALSAAAALTVAVVAGSLWLRPAGPPPPTAEQLAAIQEFETAMRYLQRSARFTQNEVASHLGSGFRDAVAVSREALEPETNETGG